MAPSLKRKLYAFIYEEGRTIKSIMAEFNVSKGSITRWCKEFREECQSSPEGIEEYDYMKENLRFRKENEEMRKEILFLKKAVAFFAKEIDQRLIGSLSSIMRNLE